MSDTPASLDWFDSFLDALMGPDYGGAIANQSNLFINHVPTHALDPVTEIVLSSSGEHILLATFILEVKDAVRENRLSAMLGPQNLYDPFQIWYEEMDEIDSNAVPGCEFLPTSPQWTLKFRYLRSILPGASRRWLTPDLEEGSGSIVKCREYQLGRYRGRERLGHTGYRVDCWVIKSSPHSQHAYTFVFIGWYDENLRQADTEFGFQPQVGYEVPHVAPPCLELDGVEPPPDVPGPSPFSPSFLFN